MNAIYAACVNNFDIFLGFLIVLSFLLGFLGGWIMGFFLKKEDFKFDKE